MKSTKTTQSARSGNFGIKSAVLLIALLGAMATSALADGNSNPGIRPPEKKSFGKTSGQWAAAWQQWAFSIPADQSPFLDETGASAGVGQSGPVWFLAGNFGGETVRNITVLETSRCSSRWSTRSSFAPNPPSQRMSPASGPSSKDSSRPLTPARSMGGVWWTWRITIPSRPSSTRPLFADNLFGLEPGVYGPAMTIGYYLMVKPLRPGTHTIHFSGLHPNGPGEEDDFSLDVTYNITVVSDDEDED